ERDGDRVLVRDAGGKVRQVIDGCPAAGWSVAGFSSSGDYLMVAHPGGVRLFRYAGSAEGGGAVWQKAGDEDQQQALIRAVVENPDDDLPRLVYADWLEEHGDPDRAEYIRLQCRLAERERDVDPTFPDPDWEREMELERANHDRWAAELPTLPG